MKSRLRTAWKWSVVVTLPVALIYLFWAWNTFDRFWNFGVRIYTSEADQITLHRVGEMEFDHLARVAINKAKHPRQSAGASGLRTIRLFVSENEIARLDANLPYSGHEYVAGGLLLGDVVNDVKVRYRGDNVYHWGYWKKSWRIKTKKSELFEGMRSFNLVAPRTVELLNNYLSYRLGSLMGLISPRSEMVSLVLNGAYQGVFILTEQLDESTLRNHGRMPGDLYSGDLVGRDRFLGIDNNLFKHVGVWEKVAINNHFPEDHRTPIERLVEVVRRPPGEQRTRELAQLVDLRAFGRFVALETLTSTVHVDATHNWRLYYDPWRTRFEPVVWDLMGFGRAMLPRDGAPPRPDVLTCPLHLALFQDADFLRARHEAIREFLDTGLQERFLREVDDVIEALDGAVEADPNMVTKTRLLAPDEVREGMRRMRNRINHVFGGLRQIYLDSPADLAYASLGPAHVALAVRGRRPLAHVAFEFQGPPPGRIEGALRFWRGEQPVEVDVSGLLNQSGSRVSLDADLLAEFAPQIETMTPGEVIANSVMMRPGYYELSLAGIAEDSSLLGVWGERGDGRWMPARRVESIPRSSFGDVYSLVRPTPTAQTEVWEGTRILEGVHELHRDLVIRPGATLRMRPGASLILHGRVLAEGTEEAPIVVVADEPGQEPWGTFALKGHGADGSRLTHVTMRAGSGLKGDLFEYSAMLSIHDVDDVLIDHCTFEDSRVVDDMFHCVYSDVRLLDSTFERSLFDAIDMDNSTALVERCSVLSSGNDGLDLMTSDVAVADCILLGNADKGISVGEQSRCLSMQNVLRGNAIGIQSKDNSVIVACNTDFVENAHAIDAYRKNWRYGSGGKVFVYNSRIQGNAIGVTADKSSDIWIDDTFLDLPVDARKRYKVDASVDGDEEVVARVKVLRRNPEEVTLMEGVGELLWYSARPRRRGAVSTE